jgi:hypothetical protein
MLNFYYEEINKYRNIIADQFNKIQDLEKLVNNLNTINQVKFESFKEQTKKELENEIKTNIELQENISLKYERFRNDIIYYKTKLDNKLNCINNLLKTNNIECPICYTQITVENLYSPGCHMNHIHCLDCSKLIEKCSLCKIPLESNLLESSNFDLNVQEHSNLVQALNQTLLGLGLNIVDYNEDYSFQGPSQL